MKSLSTALLCIVFLISAHLSAQDTIGFESFNLPLDTFVNQSAGQFESGSVTIPNTYDPTFGSWSGWAISTIRDTLTSGYINQYSCIAGSGARHSTHYAIAYNYGSSVIRLKDNAVGASISGFWVNNTTYAYLSMRDGDAFSKRFGGETGEDPDYLRLTIRVFRNGNLSSDSLDFYLADYRFDDPASDYLVKDWTYIDLLGLGKADSVHITMASSDVGIYGINTPTYFAIDDVVVTSESLSRVEVQIYPLTIFPNPAQDRITIRGLEEGNKEVQVFDLMGKEYLCERTGWGQCTLDVRNLPAGMYVLRQNVPTGERVGQFIKL